jgi:ubiquinone/menaquinone biosynthesis C-methylase UbiE
MKIIKFVCKLLGYFIGFIFVYQLVLRVIRKLYHFPVPAFVGHFLDSDYRRAIQPPHQIITRSGIGPGLKVLEVGCGSGAYTTFVARAVGKTGAVHALDIQSEMLAQISQKLSQPENQDIDNIYLHEASAYDMPFDADTFDVVYLITVLQEIPDRHRALLEINRVLKPGGTLAVTEFLPDPDYVLQGTTVAQALAAGFEYDAAAGNFWTYTARFRKTDKLRSALTKEPRMDEQRLTQARQALRRDGLADFATQAPHLQQLLQNIPILSSAELAKRDRSVAQGTPGDLAQTLALIKPQWRANNPPNSHEGMTCAVWDDTIDWLAVKFEATVWGMSSIQGGLTVARIGPDVYLFWPY